MTKPSDPAAALRKSIYGILIAVSVGAAVGRIAAVDEVDVAALDRVRVQTAVKNRVQRLHEQGMSTEEIEKRLGRLRAEYEAKLDIRRPWLSANDRSRWNTIRALVEPDMRVTREVEVDGETKRQYVWYAIDKTVAARGWDTIDKVQHALPDDPDGPKYFYSSKPPLLPTLMAAPYWVIYNTTGYSLGTERYAVTRAMLLIVNVIPYALMLIVVAAIAERWGTSDWGRVFVVAAACFATLLTSFVITLNNHLPAAFCTAVALYAALRVWFDGKRHWGYFATAAFFAAMAATCDLPALALFAALGLVMLIRAPKQAILAGVPAAALVFIAFFATNYRAHGELEPPYAHRHGEDSWYAYEGSHWNNTTGIDKGEASRVDYLIHSTIGHHGIFSLTPVWCLSLLGIGFWLAQGADPRRREAAIFVLVLSAIVFVFYMLREQPDRNYGGMTVGFRWVFWLAPLWLLVMLPAVDRMAKSAVAKGIALVLLGFSVLSVAYPTWNPWTHPWLYHFLEAWTGERFFP